MYVCVWWREQKFVRLVIGVWCTHFVEVLDALSSLFRILLEKPSMAKGVDEIVCMVQNDLKTNLLKTFKCGAL